MGIRIALLLVLCGCWATAPQLNSPDFSKARAIIEDAIANDGVPSISIAVVKDGKILWEEGFGYADKGNKRKATANTPYYTASVSKTLTATAIMKLAELKKINLDSPVNKYLGGARVSSPKFNPRDATVRRVMSHSSGITTFNSWCRGDSAQCAQTDDAYISRYAIMVQQPGRLDYSNLGYGLLDRVIRNVSGKRYPQYMKSAIFEPMGMKNSFVATDTTRSDRAIRYTGNEGEVRVEYPFSHSYQAGGSLIYSSAHDLALFAMLHLNDLKTKNMIISPKSVSAMQDTVATDGDQHYGLGWWINNDYYGYKGLLAQGGNFHAQAWMQLIPSEDVAVIVLSNIGRGKPWRMLIDEVLSTLLPTFKAHMATEPAKKDSPAAATPEPPPSKWKGIIRTYKGDVPVAFNFNGTKESTAGLGDVNDIKLANVRLHHNWFAYQLEGDLGLEDTGRGPYYLNIYLTQEGDHLYGSAQTSGSKQLDTPQLSFWVEMRKVNE